MSVVKNFTVKRRGFVLSLSDFELLDQGVTGLLGASGSGKSTLVRGLLGLIDVPGLVWERNGENLCAKPVSERGLGVVFQDFALFPHLTAKENMEFSARARKFQGDRAERLFADLVNRLDLSAVLDRKAALLSGGEKQRVALARALMGRPQFLFLDEPFSALDAELRDGARQLVKEVLKDFGVPALLISHDLADIEALASLVYELKNSQLSKRSFS